MARPQKHIVSLTEAEREQLSSISRNYRYSQRERNRAEILLLAAQGQTDCQIADQVGCHAMTSRNVRVRFCQTSIVEPPLLVTPVLIKQRIKRAEQINRAPRTFDGEKEAHLVALVCSDPPTGADRWTLQLLHDRLIEMQIIESVGKETIRRTLKKMNLNPG